MGKSRDGGLPVDLARLRARFPSLTDADLAAYATVTRRILEADSDDARARVTRDLLATARRARENLAKGQALAAEETSALDYLNAVEKMQQGTGH